LEQLVARVRLEDLQQVLAGVALRGEPAALQHLSHLAVDDRYAGHALVVGGRGEQAEEAALTDDLPLVVEPLDAHVVQVRSAVDGGA
jgi:hypothetical protein